MTKMESSAELVVFAFLALGCSPAVPRCPLGSPVLRSVPESILAVAGVRQELVFTFPGPLGCELPAGTLEARASLRSLDGTANELAIEQPQHDLVTGKVTVSLAFTSTEVTSGSSVELSVEPNLGIARIPLFIAHDGRELPSVEDISRCPSPARTRSGLVVCEHRGADGGVTVWNKGTLVATLHLAQNVAVEGDVVWLEQSQDAGRVLRRFDTSDGGLVMTASVPVTTQGVELTYADEVRYYRGDLFAYVVDGGGIETFVTIPAPATHARLADGLVGWQFAFGTRCREDGGCDQLPHRASVVGIDADTVLFRRGRDLWAYARPYADDRLLGSFQPPIYNEPKATNRGAPLAVFPEKRGNFLVQWNRDAGVPVLTWLPFGSAVWASGQFVTFEVDAGLVRFVDYRR
ncbi:MAG: hypothetical protein Q8L14_39330 [Myxococcales bacterium]|nr:hypothetical protein [Myxococcales bacterium]